MSETNERLQQPQVDTSSGVSATTNSENVSDKSDNNDKKVPSVSGHVVKPQLTASAQKPSGLPGASRIVRPCMGHHKPAVPTSPTQNTPDLMNLSDDFGKHRLTDVKEENEDDAWLYTSNLSRYRPGSIDHLWDTNSHRLYEAGLVRRTDNSVLTEDTDSFIIGDRVWIAGTKPGQIAYIGETQFAPGEWAGVALDQAIGKNDGSVGGIRYFQCEPKRGVFSRLTRLTRYPLAGADDSASVCSSTYRTSTPVNNGVKRRVDSPLSPTGSARNLRTLTPTLSTSNTSLSSTNHVIDFKIGDRVIIKSVQGSKVGTLRYMGTADFANGEWCGVELDEPKGKNDGSVGGKRYFDCRPQYGLFAPVVKVSKSPLAFKPGNCVIHTAAGMPPSAMKRTRSKESMTSMTSSFTNASSVTRKKLVTPRKITPGPSLQDVLREKQHQIEQILKERDLERAEITRAASQADEAEQKLANLKLEYAHYRSECEAKFQEFSSCLSELNAERGKLISQLEDEKHRSEDLQFRLDETAITKDDVEVTNERNKKQIGELESLLELERNKVQNFSNDSVELNRTKKSLLGLQSEVERLQSELDQSKQRKETLEFETLETITSLKEDLLNSQMKLEENQTQLKQQEEVFRKIAVSEVALAATKSELEHLKLESEQAKLRRDADEVSGSETLALIKKQLQSTEHELDEHRQRLKEHELTSTRLKETEKALLESQDELQVLNSELEKSIKTRSATEAESSDAISLLKQQLGDAQKNLEEHQSRLKDHEVTTSNLASTKETLTAAQTEVELLRVELESAVKAKEALEAASSDSVTSLKKDLENANQELQVHKNRLKEQEAVANKLLQSEEELLKTRAELSSLKDELQLTLQKRSNFEAETSGNITILQNQLEASKQALEKERAKVVEKETICKDQDAVVASLRKELSEATVAILEKASIIDQQTQQLNEREAAAKLSAEKVKLELDQKNANIESSASAIKEKEDHIRDLKNKLETTQMELNSRNADLARYEGDVQASEQSYKKEIDELREVLKNKISEYQESEKATAVIISEKDSKIEAANKAISENVAEIVNLKTELENTKESTQRNSSELQDRHSKQIEAKEELLKTLSSEIKQKNDEIAKLSTSTSQLEDELSSKMQLLEQNEHELTSLKRRLEDECTSTTKGSEKIRNLQIDFEESQQKLQTAETEILVLAQQKENIQNEFNNILRSSDDLSLKLENLNAVLLGKEQEIEQLRAEMAATVHEARTTSQNEVQMVKEEKENAFQVFREASEQSESLLKNQLQQMQEDLQRATHESETKIAALTSEIDEAKKQAEEKSALVINVESKLHALSEQTQLAESQLKTSYEERLKMMNLQENEKDGQLQHLHGDLERAKQDYESKISALTAEIEQAKKLAEEKSALVVNMEEKLNILSEQTQLGENQLKTAHEERLNAMNVQINEKDSQLKQALSEIETLKQRCGSIDSNVSEKEGQVAALTAKLKETQFVVEQLQTEKEKLLAAESDALKERTVSNENYTTLTQEATTLRTQCKETEQLRVELENQKDLYANILKLIEVTEEQKDSLLHRVEQGSGDNQSALELVKQLQVDRNNPLQNLVAELQTVIIANQAKLNEAYTQIEGQRCEIVRLQDSLSQVKKMPPPSNIPVPGSQLSANVGNKQLLEEKQLAEAQVQFLNSIIVDMQKKNEEQKMKIELLEQGFSPSAADELKLYDSHKNLPPRLYCDICEEFDLHETEDCPLQAGEDLPAPSDRVKKQPPPQRPFCDICDVFGHDTEDCTDCQTF